MPQTVLFCVGCNEKVAVPQAERHCPHCGQSLLPLLDAPTMAFNDLDARGTYVADNDTPVDPLDTLLGKRLATYSIDSFLGKGGMARVYRGTHLMLERPCAIKVLNRALVERNPDYVRMFFAEARAAASLVHPHVVTIHTINHDDGLHLIEMEYVVGRSLQRLVEAQQRLEPIEALSLLVQIGSALSEAHRLGMVHRDIKPGNVLVTETGTAKLADFGLAKRVLLDGRGSPSESLAGTPYFMAPELFDGEQADPRSDVYAMGVTLFYLLTGRYPYVDRSLAELARKHAQEPVPDLTQLEPGVPSDAAAVVARSLAKRPADRYADASELHADLKAAYGGLRSLDSLIREALAGTNVEWQGSDERFGAIVRLDNGRSQTVRIEASRGGAIAQRIVKIYSVCAPAVESYFRRALELNAALPHGSIGIELVDGQAHFVMGNSYPRATCDAEEIRQSVISIGRHADEVEQALTAGDRH